MATDTKSGQDSRIAGIWILADYWHDPDLSQTVANTLAAILVTDPDDATAIAESRAQRVRKAAAEVVGLAYDTKTKNDEQVRLRTILYGNSQTGELGAITRYQQELTSQEAVGSADQQIQQKLQATREAIRNNWENLESGMFLRLNPVSSRMAQYPPAPVTPNRIHRDHSRARRAVNAAAAPR